MSTRQSVFIILCLIAGLIFLSSVYTVREGEKALLLRLGEIIQNQDGQPLVRGPGIHFKYPLINQVRIFDTRLQTQDIKSSRIMTIIKKEVIVDYYTKWRIVDLAKYFTSTNGDPSNAERLLEQKLNDNLRAQFGKRSISDVVSGERSDVMDILLKDANKNAQSLGIEVVDVRIKRIDLPPTVSSSVYNRMRAEREQAANEHRSEGRAIAEGIRAGADRTVTETLASAESEAKRLRGEGESQAARIYGDAYNQDPDFYAFLRSLEAYRESFKSKKDFMVLKPDSEFFKYFTHSSGVTAPGQ